MKLSALVVSTAAALTMGGCSTVLDGFGSSTDEAMQVSQITPAPSGSVESSPAPALPGHGANAETAADAVTPRPGTTPVAMSPSPSAAPGGVAYTAPGAARTQMAGTWQYKWDNGQKSCKVVLSTDQGISGFAANADVDCPNDIFMTKGWDMWGNEIVLQNHLGKVTARLQPGADGQYDGVATGDGAAVTLSRS